MNEHAGRVIRVWRHALNGFNVVLPNDRAVEAIRNNPNVEYVVPDLPLELLETQSSPHWGLDRIDEHTLPMDNAFAYFQNGNGVHLYILDSGIQGTHSEFTGRLSATSATYHYPYNPYVDCNGHGTAVA